MTRLGLILLGLGLGACAHNLPAADVPNSSTKAAQVRVHVDMNGVMYPPGWRSPQVVGWARRTLGVPADVDAKIGARWIRVMANRAALERDEFAIVPTIAWDH